MKLELYEPHKVGWVSLDPYEYEYNGRYQEVIDLLESEPELQETYSVPDCEGFRELTGEDYLRRLGSLLRSRRVWDYNIVDDG